MPMNPRLLVALLLAAAGLAIACSNLLVANPCESDANCPAGQACVAGTCAPGLVEGEGEGEGEGVAEGEGEGAGEGEGEGAGEGEGEGVGEGEGEGVGEGEGEGVGEGEGEGEGCPVAADITSQAQLDALAACTTLTGDVRLSGGNVRDLTPLIGVTVIEGSFELDTSEDIEQGQSALNDLERVDGDLRFLGGEAVGLVDELTALTQVGGELAIENSGDELTVLSGFPLLVSIGADLRLRNNDFLQDIAPTAFPSLTSIGDQLHLDDNGSMAGGSRLPCADADVVRLAAIAANGLNNVNAGTATEGCAP